MTPPQQGWRRPSLLGSSRDGDGHLCTPPSRDGDGHLCPPPGVLKVFSAFSAPPLQWRPSSRLYPPAVAAFQLPCPPPSSGGLPASLPPPRSGGLPASLPPPQQEQPSGFPAPPQQWRPSSFPAPPAGAALGLPCPPERVEDPPPALIAAYGISAYL